MRHATLLALLLPCVAPFATMPGMWARSTFRTQHAAVQRAVVLAQGRGGYGRGGYGRGGYGRGSPYGRGRDGGLDEGNRVAGRGGYNRGDDARPRGNYRSGRRGDYDVGNNRDGYRGDFSGRGGGYGGQGGRVYDEYDRGSGVNRGSYGGQERGGYRNSGYDDFDRERGGNYRDDFSGRGGGYGGQGGRGYDSYDCGRSENRVSYGGQERGGYRNRGDDVYDRRRSDNRGSYGQQERGSYHDRSGQVQTGGSGYRRRQGDVADVDVAAVEALIERRTRLRRAHDYSGADAVRDELTRDFGVTVYDRDNEWFVGGGFSRGGSGSGVADEGMRGERRIGEYARAEGDFSEVDDEAAVLALLDQRSRMREQREWNRADALRNQLQEEHGVMVDDKRLEWRVESVSWAYKGHGRYSYGGGNDASDQRDGGRNARRGTLDEVFDEDFDDSFDDTLDYDDTPSTFDGDVSIAASGDEGEEDLEAVFQEMLSEVEWREARGVLSPPKLAGSRPLPSGGGTFGDAVSVPRAQPFSVARRLQSEFGIIGHDYERCPDDSKPLSADDFDPINGLLAARLDAKRGRRFDEADDLKAQLADLGVSIDDTLRQWRADGKLFDATAWSRIAGDGDTGEVDEKQVVALIERRAEAKSSADYVTADALAAELRSTHSVVLDDKGRTWRVVVEFGGYYRVGPSVDPFTTKQVADLLIRRTVHQAEEEYEQADALHASLTEMGVVLDTRLKTWKRPTKMKKKN